MTTLALLCEPHAQGRPRLTTIGRSPRAYDPPASAKWKKAVRKALIRMLEGMGLKWPLFPEGPVEAKILAVFGLPRSLERKRSPVKESWMIARPDVDNVAKATMDAATSVLWTDDSQVVVSHVQKIRAPQGQRPFVGISVAAPGCVSDYWEAALAFHNAAEAAEEIS